MMATQLYSIGAILFSVAFLLLGNGLTGTLIPVRAHLENFSDLQIGAIGSFYYIGFVAGCFVVPRILARVGHIRTFAVAAALTASTILLQPMWISPPVWFLDRAAFGFCAAGVYMVIESWLNDRATYETRGRILASYVGVNLMALMAGQWLLTIASPKSDLLFSLSAIIYTLCVVPVGMTLLPQPVPQPAPELRIRRLMHKAPVGMAGVITVGLANGAFWALAPVYAISLGFSTFGIALFMSAFILGGTLMQFPLARFSDRLDRRWIIVGICMAAAVGGAALALLGRWSSAMPWLLYPLALFFGAAMLPLYSLSIAHANDRIERNEFVEASAALLLVNALAAVAGPTIAAFVTARAGLASLFFYTAAVHTMMAVFTLTRISVKAAAPGEKREHFVSVPQLQAPTAAELDPRAHAEGAHVEAA